MPRQGCSHDSGNESKAHLPHVRFILGIMAEKSLLHDALDGDEHDRGNEDRQGCRTVDAQSEGDPGEKEPGINRMSHVAVRTRSHDLALRRDEADVAAEAESS